MTYNINHEFLIKQVEHFSLKVQSSSLINTEFIKLERHTLTPKQNQDVAFTAFKWSNPELFKHASVWKIPAGLPTEPTFSGKQFLQTRFQGTDLKILQNHKELTALKSRLNELESITASLQAKLLTLQPFFKKDDSTDTAPTQPVAPGTPEDNTSPTTAEPAGEVKAELKIESDNELETLTSEGVTYILFFRSRRAHLHTY